MNISDRILKTIKKIASELKIPEDDVTYKQIAVEQAIELDALCEISHRRELLIAFFDSIDAEDMEQQRNSKGWKVVDNYLKNIL